MNGSSALVTVWATIQNYHFKRSVLKYHIFSATGEAVQSVMKAETEVRLIYMYNIHFKYWIF